MKQANLRYSPAYSSELEEIWSDETLERIYSAEDLLETYPDMGSPLLRESLVRRYGSGVRKLVVDGYVVLYRHQGDTVEMLGIVSGGAVS